MLYKNKFEPKTCRMKSPLWDVFKPPKMREKLRINRASIKFQDITECFKKNGAVFILQISRQPNIRFSNHFYLLNTEIHMQILNTKTFLCDHRGPGYFQNEIRF